MPKERKPSPTKTRKRAVKVKEEPKRELTGRERRRAPRVKVNLPARWEGDGGRQAANVTSLSKLGCFVLSGGKVKQKELIRLEIMFPDDATSSLWGEVVDAAEEIGFAMQFTSSEDADQSRLEQFLEPHLIAQGEGSAQGGGHADTTNAA
jgi:hypothetical protein